MKRGSNKPAAKSGKTQLKPIRVGLLGIGTVGSGAWEVLRRNADEIQRRAGRAIEITVVADKAVDLARSIVKGKARVGPTKKIRCQREMRGT